MFYRKVITVLTIFIDSVHRKDKNFCPNVFLEKRYY